MKAKFFPIALVLSLLLATETLCRADEKTVRVHFVQVGYGDAIVIEMPDSSTILIDAGPPESAKKLSRYLQKLKIAKLDTVILTHPHINHFGGLTSLVNNFSIGRVFVNGDANADEGYADLKNQLKTKSIPIATLRRGMNISNFPKEALLKILHPEKTDSDVNDNSLVVYLQFGRTSFLFTGDMEKTEEVRLASSNFELESNILKVAHHGSKNSSTLLFLEKVAPSIAVVSSGKNRYGHPHQEALDRLASVGAKILRTDEQSTILIKSDGDSFVVSPDIL